MTYKGSIPVALENICMAGTLIRAAQEEIEKNRTFDA